MPYSDHDIKKISNFWYRGHETSKALYSPTHLTPSLSSPIRLSLFIYCNTAWGNCGITLRKNLQKLQKWAARVITLI